MPTPCCMWNNEQAHQHAGNNLKTYRSQGEKARKGTSGVVTYGFSETLGGLCACGDQADRHFLKFKCHATPAISGLRLMGPAPCVGEKLRAAFVAVWQVRCLAQLTFVVKAKVLQHL